MMTGISDAWSPPTGRDARPCVLVVDDSAINRTVLTNHLDQLGLASVSVESGPEALECMAAQRFDAVLLGLRMPGMDGFEVARRIRATATGADVFARDDACAASGIDHKLNKPLALADLRAVLLPHVAADAADTGEVAAAIDRVMSFLGGSARTAELVEEWLTVCPIGMTAIARAVASNDAAALAGAAARLRAATAPLDIRPITGRVGALERAAARGEIDEAGVDALAAVVSASASELTAWLARLDAAVR